MSWGFFLPFVCFRSVHGWMGMDVRVNVFNKPFLCADSGPWRKMSRAWPPMSAITTSSGTRTRGAWWCRYRGHWRSGPRHLSPRSRVCAQEWHPKDIHSHIYSHPPMHTPQKQKQTKNNRKTLNSPNMMPSFTGPLPVQCAGGRRPGSLAQDFQDCSTSDGFSPRTVLI